MYSASALQKKAERLRNAHAKLRIKLRKAKPEACVAEVDAWLAGADKSPANTPRDKKNCSCEACGAVVRNKPLIPGAHVRRKWTNQQLWAQRDRNNVDHAHTSRASRVL